MCERDIWKAEGISYIAIQLIRFVSCDDKANQLCAPLLNNGTNLYNIYIIIRHCPGVGAFPRPFCVPNSVALASLTLQVGDWAIH